jgi:chemotaxis protein CheX
MARSKKGSGKSRPPKAKGRKATKRKVLSASAAIGTDEDASASTATSILMLSDCLDADAAAPLKDALLQRRGKPIIVDAGQVRRVGAQSLQVLIAAARTWRRDDQAYQVANPSADFLDTMALAGLSRDDLLIQGSPS